MNRNVGASFTLSILTVLTFAVVLYQPDPPPTPPAGPRAAPAPLTSAATVDVIEARDPDALRPTRAAPAPATARREEVGTVARSAPATDRTRPAAPAAQPTSSEAARPRLASRRVITETVSKPRAAEAVAAPGHVVATAVPGPGEARGAFTKVRPGESLAAVALRVYGSDDAAEQLWSANRDLLDREDAPLREGTLLRTP
jgi:hypothetical protein